jgi:hypothetical protein
VLLVSPVLVAVAAFWLLTAWTTKRADYSACLRLANAVERVRTREEVTKLLSGVEVTNEKMRLVALCRPHTAQLHLPRYPIQALEIEVSFDQQQRVVSTTTNDVIVW